jgi:Domain of unknown function (DUF5615)
VRLFLDAHVSARRIATALREQHDVRAVDEERELDAWDDERLLALATEQGRIMVTFNVNDFARITTEWAAAGKSHAGCRLIVGIDHAEFGLILPVIDHALSTQAGQAAWIDYTAWGLRSTTTQGGPACATGPPRFGTGRRSGGRKPEGINQRTDPASRSKRAQTKPPSAPDGRNVDGPKPSRTSTPETNKWP